MKMKQTECSETSAYKIQTPRNYPEENKQQRVLNSNTIFHWWNKVCCYTT